VSLIIETGTGVTGANSYVTVDEFRAYAEARGVSSITTDDADYEVYLIKAIDKLESYWDKYQGLKVTTAQPLQFPRMGVVLDEMQVEQTTIPRNLKYAQMAYAMESLAGEDLLPNSLVSSPAAVISEKVGDIEVAYANPTSLRSTPAFAKGDALLAPLLKRQGLFGVRS
jgi:hypothetical protein